MPPSSAWISASRRTAAPPMTHEISDAGPAMSDALSAPNNQPEPMIEPTEANRSPTIPTSRRSLRPATGVAPKVGEVVVIAPSSVNIRSRDARPPRRWEPTLPLRPPPSPAVSWPFGERPTYSAAADLWHMVPARPCLVKMERCHESTGPQLGRPLRLAHQSERRRPHRRSPGDLPRPARDPRAPQPW